MFRYKLSQARHVVENALYSEVQPEFVDKIVLASCCLHNTLCADYAFEPDVESLQLPEAELLNLDL